MTSVFLLWHLGHEPAEGEDSDEGMLLGVFSSEQAALAWKADATSLPGFRDWPDRFEIAEYALDRRTWLDGFETVRWTEPDPERLTCEQAFEAMFRFLDRYLREFKTANLSDVLGDIQPAVGGKSADPAEWARWQSCVQEVLDHEQA